MMKDKYDFCILKKFKNPKKIKVLDYGCGDGSFLQYLKKQGVSCEGFEIDKASIKKLENKKIQFSEDIDKIKPNSLDLCVMFDVLEHLSDPIYLKQIWL